MSNRQQEIERLHEADRLQEQLINCRRCSRLVEWREGVAKAPPRRHVGKEYWARPVPNFGQHDARVMLVGLAPGAHGSNRTGRVFTGDGSGVFLFASLFRTGFSNQPESRDRFDALRLNDMYITAAVRCAPPMNKPTLEEIANCRPYLLRELELLTELRVIIGLGKIGFDAAFDATRQVGLTDLKPRPRFGHATEVKLSTRLTLLGTYHPSQQNTFTGRLTQEMMDAVFMRTRELVNDKTE
jgi:uracil-DNA glycosylase family 4